MVHNNRCVLIGITITEIIFAIVNYVFLRYLFKNFNKKYENKEVIKTFKSDNETKFLKDNTKIKDDGAGKNKTLKKILLNIALIALIIGVIWIVLSPISVNDYSIFIGGIICLAICTVSIYLITRLNRPIISLLGFIASAIILFTFMHSYGNESILWFILAEIFIVFITIILKR